LLILIDPTPIDAGLNMELRLAMVVDVLDVDGDRSVLGRAIERLFDCARIRAR
jgi:hypothetical protein